MQVYFANTFRISHRRLSRSCNIWRPSRDFSCQTWFHRLCVRFYFIYFVTKGKWYTTKYIEILNFCAYILDAHYDVRESGVWRLPDIDISGSLLAEVSGRSPRIAFISIILKTNLGQSIQNIFYLILKTEALIDIVLQLAQCRSDQLLWRGYPKQLVDPQEKRAAQCFFFHFSSFFLGYFDPFFF